MGEIVSRKMPTAKNLKDQILEDSVVHALILPHINPQTRILEIGCHHGQWTKYFSDAAEVIATDADPENINFCKHQFASLRNYRLELINNANFSFLNTESIDFIWSFNTFIYFSPETTFLYLQELSRILSPNGKCFIHHPGRKNYALKFQKLNSFGTIGRKTYQALSLQKYLGDDGKRSQISPELFSSLALKANLVVEAHIFNWGKYKQFSLKPYNDYISIVTRNLKLLKIKF